jgi:hypothetical protein
MKIFALPAILLAFVWYVVPVNETVLHKRPAKLFYDRIEVGVEPVRVQRCKTPGTVWWKGECFRPERIARS